MTFPYIAPAQIIAIIGNVVLDDCCGIGWEVVTPTKRPVYGYFDSHVRSWIKGQTLVRGTICVQFRFTNSLHWVLEAQNDAGNQEINEQLKRFQVDADVKPSLPTALQSLLAEANQNSANVSSALTEIARFAMRDRQSLIDFADYMRATRGQGSQDTSRLLPHYLDNSLSVDAADLERAHEVVTDPIWGSDAVHPRVDIFVVYGHDANIKPGSDRVEIIEDVQFTSQGKQIVADVPMGGNPIQEEYQFLARRVVPVRPIRPE